MTDETDLTFKTRLIRAWAWIVAHPDLAWPLAAFVLGIVVGWVLL